MSQQSIKEMFNLSGRNAIITGGALGIGQAIAFRLAEAGAGVLIADIDQKAAEKTVEEITSKNGKALAVTADARSADDAKKVVQLAVQELGSIDILVNNAGIFPLMPVLDTTEEMWDNVIDINLKGAFLFSQAAGREMAATGNGGKIINLASIDAFHPNGMATHYNASKGGVLMLTRAMALELAPHKIIVNAIAPGGIMTPGTADVRENLNKTLGLSSEDIIGGWVQRVPLQKMGEPDDIAKVALFLASSAADYITGEVILVDGGYLLS